MMEVKGMADVPGVRAIYVNSCAPRDKKSYVCVCANRADPVTLVES